MRPGWAAVVFVALLGAACAPIVRRVTLNGAGEAFMTLGLRERVSVEPGFSGSLILPASLPAVDASSWLRSA